MHPCGASFFLCIYFYKTAKSKLSALKDLPKTLPQGFTNPYYWLYAAVVSSAAAVVSSAAAVVSTSVTSSAAGVSIVPTTI